MASVALRTAASGGLELDLSFSVSGLSLHQLAACSVGDGFLHRVASSAHLSASSMLAFSAAMFRIRSLATQVVGPSAWRVVALRRPSHVWRGRVAERQEP